MIDKNVEKYQDFKKEIVTFTGYISQDVDIKYFESGAIKARFSIPLKRKKEDEPLWLNCIAWGKLAERIAEDFGKNSLISVQGYFKLEKGKDDKEYLNFIVCFAG